MVLVGLLRHYVTLLLNSAPKKQPAGLVKEQRAILRSQILRSSAPLCPLPPAQYTALSESLINSLSNDELLQPTTHKRDEKDATPANPLTDPTQMEGMMDGIKKQAVMMVPNMVIMQWINVFFSGFVLSEFGTYISWHHFSSAVSFTKSGATLATKEKKA